MVQLAALIGQLEESVWTDYLQFKSPISIEYIQHYQIGYYVYMFMSCFYVIEDLSWYNLKFMLMIGAFQLDRHADSAKRFVHYKTCKIYKLAKQTLHAWSVPLKTAYSETSEKRNLKK